MKRIVSVVFLVFLAFNLSAQDNLSLSNKLKKTTKKGDYIILELRLNKEDEFRTMEGGQSSMARMAVYSGGSDAEEIMSKDFMGMNSVVKEMNDLKRGGWRLLEVYPVKGESLIITHYIFERKK